MSPAPRRRPDRPRRAAFDALRLVNGEGAYANLELPAIIRRHRLDARDAAFATELAFGTLRMQGFYDAVIEHAASRPTSKVDSGVLDVLRLGAHQLLGMRVPSHAAADQTVGLARTVSGAGASGFVNAVMRRIVASLATLCLLLAGCGDDGGADQSAAPSTRARSCPARSISTVVGMPRAPRARAAAPRGSSETGSVRMPRSA